MLDNITYKNELEIISQILDLLPETIILVDSSETIIFCNCKAEHFMGLPANEIVGCSFGTLEEQFKKLLRNPGSCEPNLQGLAGNPECEWSRYFLLVNGQEFSFMTRPLEGCGQLASRVCYFKFRNSIVSLGEDVEYNHIKYRHFFDDFPFGLIRYGLYGKLLAANTAAAQMFGYESQSEIVALINGSSVGDVLLKNESMLIKLEKIALESAGTWFRGEVRFVRQDGTAFDGELFLLATSDHNPSFYGVIRDISPQKGAEREFQENQKRMRSSFQMLKDLIDSHSNAFQISNHIESPQSLPKASRLLEMNYIEAALRKTKGRVQPAARLLGISRYTLIRQIAKMGIDTKKFKD